MIAISVLSLLAIVASRCVVCEGETLGVGRD